MKKIEIPKYTYDYNATDVEKLIVWLMSLTTNVNNIIEVVNELVDMKSYVEDLHLRWGMALQHNNNLLKMVHEPKATQLKQEPKPKCRHLPNVYEFNNPVQGLIPIWCSFCPLCGEDFREKLV